MVLENREVGLWINRKVDAEQKHVHKKFEQWSYNIFLGFTQEFRHYLKHPPFMPFSRYLEWSEKNFPFLFDFIEIFMGKQRCFHRPRGCLGKSFVGQNIHSLEL